MCRQLQLAYSHWMAACGANYRCCSLLGRGKRRVLIHGKVDTSSVLKRKLSSYILGLNAFLPQGQDSDKCCPLRIIPPCSKLSVIVCTFPFGLKVKWIIRKIHLHHNAKQEGSRALKLSFFIKFWTLYKGKCLRFCEKCANPRWIEIYLKLLLFVQKHVQSIYVFLLQVCVYMNPFI